MAFEKSLNSIEVSSVNQDVAYQMVIDITGSSDNFIIMDTPILHS